MVDRVPWAHEVVGSNPASPTSSSAVVATQQHLTTEGSTMWGKSSKSRKAAVRRRAIVRPLEEAHLHLTWRVFGARLTAVMEAQARAQKAAANAKLKAKRAARLQGRVVRARG